MARRYITISGIGRCTIVLEGVNSQTRRRVRLAHHIATGAVFFVASGPDGGLQASVTTWPTFQLLDVLAKYDWWMPLSMAEDPSSPSADDE